MINAYFKTRMLRMKSSDAVGRISLSRSAPVDI